MPTHSARAIAMPTRRPINGVLERHTLSTIRLSFPLIALGSFVPEMESIDCTYGTCRDDSMIVLKMCGFH